MALNTIFKARKAMKLHNEGKFDEALKLYEECMSEGMTDMKAILPYSVLLLRSGQYQKAREAAGSGAEISHGGRPEAAAVRQLRRGRL